MAREHDEQTIALAGIFQAAALVSQIAHRGMVSQNCYEASIASLFVENPETTEDVYGGAHDLPYNLGVGLRTIQELVDKSASDFDPNIMKYALNLIQLERKLVARPDMLELLDKGLGEQRKKAAYFSSSEQSIDDPFAEPSRFTHSNVVAGIASLYQDTISTFSQRIQVSGDPRHLQNPDNAARIRALLLTGIRAALLWRQVGGKRWHLFMFKSRVRPSLAKIKPRV